MTLLWKFLPHLTPSLWCGWMRQRCSVAFVTRAPYWYWCTVRQGLLGAGWNLSFLLFLHFLSFPSFFPIPLLHLLYYLFSLPASVAQLDTPSDWRPGGRGFNPRRGRQHSFVEIDHEIFSTVILSLPLIQEGQLSVSGERMCTILVNRLED